MMRGAAGAQRGALVVADILACLCGGAMMEGWMEGADLSLCDNVKPQTAPTTAAGTTLTMRVVKSVQLGN